jgi:hypothetical protein
MNIATIDGPGSGTATSALCFGGNTPVATYATSVQSWNGTNWTNENSMSIGRRLLGGAGASNTSGVAFGGDTPGVTAATEEWYGDSIFTKTVTTD